MEILTWAQRKTVIQTQFVSVLSKVISDGIFIVVSYRSGVWGGAPAEIDFGSFYALCSLLIVFFVPGGSRPIIFLHNFFSVAPLLGGPMSSGALDH